jgi:HD superfamily phosphohydrolase
MKQELNKRKIINDPVYGFISIPGELIFDIIEHPYFQRLRRIKQLGLTNYVYPSAIHSRFQHALGCLHLMTQVIEVLRSKGQEITMMEAEGAMLAILLHDIGHGPFSHTLEQSIVKGLSHEHLSKLIIGELNEQFDNKLSIAESIFNDSYPKRFLHQLVASQLDMDRLDYLTRDSFFTGVAEGVINADRIIKMLTVRDDELLVEAKGIYSIEKFIVSRRLMYWQVYYHKTVMATEYMLINILRRAKYLAAQGENLFSTPALKPFLQKNITPEDFINDRTWLHHFTALDDYDVFASIKAWMDQRDPILSMLCRRMIDRVLYRVELRNEPFQPGYIEDIGSAILEKYKVPESELGYFLTADTVANNAYNPRQDKIRLLFKDGKIMDISEASDQLNISVLATTVSKHVLCYPKDLNAGRSRGRKKQTPDLK